MDIHVVVEGQSFCVELPESECDVWKAIGDALLVETGLRAECFTTEAGLDGICAGDTVHLVTVQRLVARRELQAWGWGPDEWTIRLRKFAAEGDVEKVRLLVEAEIDDEESGVVPPKAPSPLFAACLNNHVEVVRLLLQGGASMEEGFGQAHASVLIAAALSSAEAIVLLLLEHGADPCAVSRVRDPVTDFSKHYTMPVGTLGRTTYLWMGATPVNVAARKGMCGWGCFNIVGGFFFCVVFFGSLESGKIYGGLGKCLDCQTVPQNKSHPLNMDQNCFSDDSY